MVLGPNMVQAVLDLAEAAYVCDRNGPDGGPGGRGVAGRSRRHGDVGRLGEVVWCVQAADGTHCVGIRFARRLDYATRRDLSQFGEA